MSVQENRKNFGVRSVAPMEWDFTGQDYRHEGTPARLPGETDKDHRRRIQEGLVSDFSALPDNEPVEIHEVEFVSRMEFVGHRLKWLPRDQVGRLSTYDFEWLTAGGMACELKCTTGKYATIKGEIHRAVKRSRGHMAQANSFGKDTFIVDLGARAMTEKLRSQLEKYNVRVEYGRIETLFVMSSDGSKFERIELVQPDPA